MSKAKRQMPEQSGRVSVVHGEAVRDPISDEACDPLTEHPDIGSANSMAGTGGLLEKALTREKWVYPDSHDLKLSNRRVRTRMPGGVAGEPSMTGAPYADIKSSAGID